MIKRKPSFFERLTGSVALDESDVWEASRPLEEEAREIRPRKEWGSTPRDFEEEEEDDAELAVDVYQTPNEVILKTMVAGVRPEDVTIQISRDSVTIKGRREEERNIADGDYFYQELYWGSFIRTIALPHEVDPDEAEAVDRHGLLTIRLPKIDKTRVQKVKIKSVS
jgi:HSP20 family protein